MLLCILTQYYLLQNQGKRMERHFYLFFFVSSSSSLPTWPAFCLTHRRGNHPLTLEADPSSSFMNWTCPYNQYLQEKDVYFFPNSEHGTHCPVFVCNTYATATCQWDECARHSKSKLLFCVFVQILTKVEKTIWPAKKLHIWYFQNYYAKRKPTSTSKWRTERTAF